MARAIADAFPGSRHLADAGLLGAADRAVWDYAVANGFVLVSKDEDFHRLSVLHGPPAKVIWIRTGNCSTDEVIALLRGRQEQIKSFVADEEARFLALA